MTMQDWEEEFYSSIAPYFDKPYTAVLNAIGADGEKLIADSWHCGGTHCLAGWLVELAGVAGRTLERDHGTGRAAKLILRRSCPGAELPGFYWSKVDLLAFIAARAAEEK